MSHTFFGNDSAMSHLPKNTTFIQIKDIFLDHFMLFNKAGIVYTSGETKLVKEVKSYLLGLNTRETQGKSADEAQN